VGGNDDVGEGWEPCTWVIDADMLEMVVQSMGIRINWDVPYGSGWSGGSAWRLPSHVTDEQIIAAFDKWHQDASAAHTRGTGEQAKGEAA
jgi:hypothetical protein